ncbi:MULTISPECIES: sulfatase-like hydrolase/transferase [Paenibacillus]|uniref:sulfatase-like hydrolase/transferase n=1 Tax=Paenibacillus TaxID=44249 RepID=UPI0003F6D301|nr:MULTISPECIES: sulfatase-like hydrolase/transferase [Paenibacillus]
MNEAPAPSRSTKKPNFLVLLVDEERYPPIYESEELKAWRKESLAAQEYLRANGLEFHRHYIGSTACCPSRATLFTGHYPSLHGVSQTDGIAKSAFDSDMYWLNSNTVPTMGNYFREAGYQTYYKGKWHLSNADITIPGTHKSLPSYDPLTGVPDPEQERVYEQAGRLESYGFSSWIGPEPHGKNPRNSASSAAFGLSGRDEVYGTEAAELIEALDRSKDGKKEMEPWLIVASFVNPHDIVLYGALAAQLPDFSFEVEPMPPVAPPPTLSESLAAKPRCQASYRDIYPRALQPIIDNSFYRQLYYQLQKNADRQMAKVVDALVQSSFYDNTIVIFTSDHGDLLGAHGNLHQKFYCAYEEMLHVPLVIHHKQLIPEHRDIHALTSHVDLLPTMLGLANVDILEIQQRLQTKFSEVRTFVGRDLAPWIRDQAREALPDEPIYFMTDDDATRGQHQANPLGAPYPSVVQPNHIETVLAAVQRQNGKEIWKLSRYFDNIQFWSEPGIQDETMQPVGDRACGTCSTWVKQIKTKPAADEFELYNLTCDPLEACNLAHPLHASQETLSMMQGMMQLLKQQSQRKRLYPAQPPSLSGAAGAVERPDG